MKKSLIALAVLAMAGSAFATGSYSNAATGTARSVSATYAQAGNGGSSVSKAGNFSMAVGSTDSSVGKGYLSVTVPECNVPTTATVFGTITTVRGEVATVGGSYANNVSTGNGTGSAFAYGVADADVAKNVGSVGGAASSLTETWAGAGKNQSNSSFASQEASFVAKGGTGVVVLTEEVKTRWGTYDRFVAAGFGAVTTGHSEVSKSSQVVGSTNNCQNCNTSNPGALFNSTVSNVTGWNTATGSNTFGTASTFADVSITVGQPQ